MKVIEHQDPFSGQPSQPVESVESVEFDAAAFVDRPVKAVRGDAEDLDDEQRAAALEAEKQGRARKSALAALSD